MSSAESPTEQSDLHDHGLKYQQSKYDWTLPGLGEPGDDCGKNRIPLTEAVCPNGDSLRYEPLKCRLVECPDCYKTEQLDRKFKIVLEVEAYARKHDERPHTLHFSVPDYEAREWTYDRLNNSLFKRFYRRFERAETRNVRCDGYSHSVEDCPDCYEERTRCDDAGTHGHSVDDCPDCYEERVRCDLADHTVSGCDDCHDVVPDNLGGYAVFHPWRILDARKDALRRHGYGSHGDLGSLWDGVKDDALGLADPRKYVKFSPHGHNIGFPGWIEEHDDPSFHVQKDGTLETLKEVVGNVGYLLHHRGVRTDETGRSVRSWGIFDGSTDGWDGAKEEFSGSEYQTLIEDISAELGVHGWDDEKGRVIVEESDCECPNCGAHQTEFMSLWELGDAIRGNPMGRPWIDRLSPSQRGFWKSVLAERTAIRADDERDKLFVDDLDPPDDVTVWSVEEQAAAEADGG